jgi:hypothetical protein
MRAVKPSRRGQHVEQDRSDITNRISGGVSGPAIQAHSITGGVHVHLHAVKAAVQPVPRQPSPSGWAELPELPDEVRSLLQAQVQAAKELPYRLPGAKRPSLATVYVRQDLGSSTEEPISDQPRPEPILDARGQLVDPPNGPVLRAAVRPPARKVREALDDDDYLLVTGGPGQGKSTLSLRVAANAAEQWASPDPDAAPLDEPVVPLRLTARVLAARLDLTFPEALAESARAEYNAMVASPLRASVLSERVAGCRWLLLVDGLDEIADRAERDRLVSVLAAWASHADSPYRFVLTTRPIEGAALAPLQRIGVARYELQSFDEKALRSFADSWFESVDLGYRFVRQIRKAHLDELVRVPLLATIAAIIFEKHRSRPLPDNQYELYGSYLRYLRTAHPVAPSPFDGVHDALLEHLGRVRLEEDTSLVTAAQNWIGQHIPNLAGNWQEELVTYLTASGLLIRRGDDLRFLHHSFAEHLAATAKARLLPERFLPEHVNFAGLLHAARPPERGLHARAVLLHYTRLNTAEADRLINWLHTGGPDQHLLAARLLAAHTPAGPDVVNAFLATVRAWAMTTQYPGEDILAQASRAGHHPDLPSWLTALMRDEDAPWPSRIEAATALSTRLRGPDTPEAVALLRDVVDGTSASVKDRLAAAEALVDCGTDEREAAERGLRSVLADPSATGWICRNAAVVLAGFDGTARAYAVEALTRLLDDPWTPDDELADAASGLVEIGVDHHERCAEIFRMILVNRTDYSAGLRDAAIGLASLGPRHLADSVSALTRLITDRRIDRLYRIMIADVFTELGPQHRAAAGEHLLAISSEFDVTPSERQQVAGYLAQIGLTNQAIALLRATLADQEAMLNARLWTAQGLANVGPEHHEEAARILREVADHPFVTATDRAGALGKLAALGVPYRTPALAELHDVLVDRNMEPSFRNAAAQELIKLGPEFHEDVANHILEIALYHPDPDVRADSWRALRNLGTQYRDQASVALLALTRTEETASWESHRSNWMPYIGEIVDNESLATALTEAFRDPNRSGETRMEAACRLVGVGKQFHRIALDGAVELLRSWTAPDPKIVFVASGFSRLGAAPRVEFANAMRAIASHPFATPTTVCRVAEAMERLDYRNDPQIITALRGIVSDDVVDPDIRGEAAVVLTRAIQEAQDDIVAVTMRSEPKLAYAWQREISDIAALGADVVPRLHALLTDVDTKRPVRESAAATLAQLHRDPRGEALSELRTQASDELLEFMWRTDAMLRLAQLDPTTRGEAITYHRAVLDDVRQPVRDRCEAAYQLAQLDKSLSTEALTALRRFATSLDYTVQEHGQGVYQFARLSRHRAPEIIPMALAVARDPAAAVWVRSNVRTSLWGKAQLETERSLLADRTASPSQRVRGLNAWEHRALGEEAETVLRDVLTSVDSTPAERVEAAAALGKLAPRHRQEAVRLLKTLSQERCGAAEARTELADLSLPERRRMVVDAERVVADKTHPWRERAEAAALVVDLRSNPPGYVVDFLRQLANDPQIAEYQRLEIHYALRAFDGLAPVRALRDDERTRPAVRWKAANRLSDYDVADRAAGARILNAIANDVTCRPALRWRAARDLTDFGERGRELGVAALQAMVGDDTLPCSARVAAATSLGNVRPDQRVEVLRLLRGFSISENPRVCLKVLAAIGRFDSVEGALALGHMAADGTLPPGVRLRATNAMIGLRRDYQDRAAAVAQEVALGAKNPRHIRAKAARKLARWSTPCRGEAQALLSQFDRPMGAQSST